MKAAATDVRESRGRAARATEADETSVVIGWTEYVDLPEWKVFGLRAKVDTGARSSALHVENIELLGNGEVGFDVVRRRNAVRPRTRVTAPVARHGAVRSSSGHCTPRIFVETMLRLGGVEKRIEIGLVDRGPMIHRMLLGRNALAGPFLIDVGRRLALGQRKQRKPRKPRTRR